VLAQDERKAWVWVRTDDRFPPGPMVIEGDDAAVDVPALALELSLSELYDGIAFD
jgi:hypothetical protein